MRLSRLWPVLLVLALGACRGTVGGNTTVDPVSLVKRPWTAEFLAPAVLVADEVTIEGPEDLLEHVALGQDPQNTEYTTKTTSEGLRQEVRPKRGLLGVEVRAQLDGWQIVALRKLVVLQRPGEVPVTIRARGNAFWSAGDGSDQKRAAQLEFRGDRE